MAPMPATGFYRFGDLPTELKLRILVLAMPRRRSRVIQLKSNGYTHLKATYLALPAVYFINKALREELMKSYVSLFANASLDSARQLKLSNRQELRNKVFINPELDVLYIPENIYRLLEVMDGTQVSIPNNLSTGVLDNLTTLAVNYKVWKQLRPSVVEEIGHFRALATLIIVFDAPRNTMLCSDDMLEEDIPLNWSYVDYLLGARIRQPCDRVRVLLGLRHRVTTTLAMASRTAGAKLPSIRFMAMLSGGKLLRGLQDYLYPNATICRISLGPAGSAHARPTQSVATGASTVPAVAPCIANISPLSAEAPSPAASITSLLSCHRFVDEDDPFNDSSPPDSLIYERCQDDDEDDCFFNTIKWFFSGCCGRK